MTDSELELAIDGLIVALATPVTAEETADGWNVESKNAIGALLLDTLRGLRAGDSIPRLSISRGLDHWGVGGGKLLERLATPFQRPATSGER